MIVDNITKIALSEPKLNVYMAKFNIFKNQKKNDFLILKKNIELNSLKTIPRKIFLRIPRKKNYIEVHGLKVLLKNLKIVGSATKNPPFIQPFCSCGFSLNFSTIFFFISNSPNLA